MKAEVDDSLTGAPTRRHPSGKVTNTWYLAGDTSQMRNTAAK
jgi:hypothetical protein